MRADDAYLGFSLHLHTAFAVRWLMNMDNATGDGDDADDFRKGLKAILGRGN